MPAGGTPGVEGWRENRPAWGCNPRRVTKVDCDGWRYSSWVTEAYRAAWGFWAWEPAGFFALFSA